VLARGGLRGSPHPEASLPKFSLRATRDIMKTPDEKPSTSPTPTSADASRAPSPGHDTLIIASRRAKACPGHITSRREKSGPTSNTWE
jgi:hypothetical protein